MTKDETLQMCLEYIETDAHERKYVRHAIKQALSAPVQEPEVSWGVDWAKAGDKSCATIIKRLPNGKIEVVAVEYEP